MRSACAVCILDCMETTQQTEGPRHLADRPEREATGALGVFINPNAACTGSEGGHHVKPCPKHHPGSYAKVSPRRWKHRQAVTA